MALMIMLAVNHIIACCWYAVGLMSQAQKHAYLPFFSPESIDHCAFRCFLQRNNSLRLNFRTEFGETWLQRMKLGEAF